VSIRPAVFWLHLLVGVTAIASGGGAVLVWTGLSLAWPGTKPGAGGWSRRSFRPAPCLAKKRQQTDTGRHPRLGPGSFLAFRFS